MTMPQAPVQTPTQPKVGTTTLFLTSRAFGQPMKTIGQETNLKTTEDPRNQLESQASGNVLDERNVLRFGGWYVINTAQRPGQSVVPLAQLIAPTVAATFNTYGRFSGTPLTTEDVERVLTDMRAATKNTSSLAFSRGRNQARVMTTNLATSKDDADQFARLVTEATLQVARWCDRIKPEQINRESQQVTPATENELLQTAVRTIQAKDATGEYATTLPGFLVTNVNILANAPRTVREGRGHIDN